MGTHAAPTNGDRGGRPGWVLEFDEDFGGDTLDPGRWIPYHLPHWSSRVRAAARYRVEDGSLRLRIDADQPPWCPEFDDGVRVSSLQTAVFAGPVGSTVGQHRFSPWAVVREAQPETRLYTPQYGLVEMRAKATRDARSMVALWMIGVEDAPERSAEICVCEIFGRTVRPDRAEIGMGVHPFGDPRIVDEFAARTVPIDVTEFHTYAAEWSASQVEFSVDGRVVTTVAQSPAYPMQLMLGIYEFPVADRELAPDETYPKELVVEHVRGYRRA